VWPGNVDARGAAGVTANLATARTSSVKRPILTTAQAPNYMKLCKLSPCHTRKHWFRGDLLRSAISCVIMCGLWVSAEYAALAPPKTTLGRTLRGGRLCFTPPLILLSLQFTGSDQAKRLHRIILRPESTATVHRHDLPLTAAADIGRRCSELTCNREPHSAAAPLSRPSVLRTREKSPELYLQARLLPS
jgi:hypothetical protein